MKATNEQLTGRELELEKQAIAVENHRIDRKSYFVQDEYFTNTVMPEFLKANISPAFQKVLDDAFSHLLDRCPKCKEVKQINDYCCGV